MTTVPVVFPAPAELRDAPIAPDWIIEGDPRARNAILAWSADKMAWTIAWECTAGKFEWTYDIDEVVHVVEGGMWLEDGHSPKRFVGAGEVVFFPAGSRAVWTVDDYVRKVAFCKRALPNAVSLMVRALRKARTMMSRGPGEGGALLSA